MTLLEQLGDLIWNPWMLGLFLLVGAYFTVRTGFFQLLCAPLWLKTTLGTLFRPHTRTGRGITQFQALSTALAATIGTGSIAGVATAIFYGGPGAVFWMWISALLGMMTGCAEKTLAVAYRKPDGKNGWRGGPMCYMTDGLGLRPLAVVFCIFCVAACFVGGNMVQANSIATALTATFDWSPLLVGSITAVLVGVVIFGGVKRIAEISAKLVPGMALLFLTAGIAVLFCRWQEIPNAMEQIISEAFRPNSIMGGGMGYGMISALRYGVARGVFTNEAGLGSSAMAHAAADVKEPAAQGMWGILEVFVSTIIVCTITALAILTTGVYSRDSALSAIQTGHVEDSMLGAPLSAAAFSSVLGRWGAIVVCLCLLLFAFSSLLGWSYYGEQCVEFLAGSRRYTTAFRFVFLVCIVVGSVAELSSVWHLADVFEGLMALPNLIALLLLSPEAIKLIKVWKQNNKMSL